MCIYHICTQIRVHRKARPSGTRVIGGWELPVMGDGNQTQVLLTIELSLQQAPRALCTIGNCSLHSFVLNLRIISLDHYFLSFHFIPG